jgi:hypothetical protein
MSNYKFKGLSYFNQDEASFNEIKDLTEHCEYFVYNRLRVYFKYLVTSDENLVIVYIDDTNNSKGQLDPNVLCEELELREIEFNREEINKILKYRNHDKEIKKYIESKDISLWIKETGDNIADELYRKCEVNNLSELAVLTVESDNHESHSVFLFGDLIWDILNNVYAKNVNEYIKNTNPMSISIVKSNFDISRVINSTYDMILERGLAGR